MAEPAGNGEERPGVESRLRQRGGRAHVRRPEVERGSALQLPPASSLLVPSGQRVPPHWTPERCAPVRTAPPRFAPVRRAHQVGVAQIGSGQDGMRQVGATEVGAGQLHADALRVVGGGGVADDDAGADGPGITGVCFRSGGGPGRTETQHHARGGDDQHPRRRRAGGGLRAAKRSGPPSPRQS